MFRVQTKEKQMVVGERLVFEMMGESEGWLWGACVCENGMFGALSRGVKYKTTKDLCLWTK